MLTSKVKDKRKSAAYRRVRRRNITLGLFAFLILCGICIFTPVFGVSKISVTGNKILSDRDIIKASDIEIGDNFFFLDTGEIETAINALGYIDKVDVKRKFFTRIEIAVTEARESAYVAFSGNYVGIDVTGKVLSVNKSSKINPKKAVISGFKIKSVSKGEIIVPANESKFRVVTEILKLLEGKKILPYTSKIELTDLKNIYLVLDTQTRIILGNSDDLEYKIEYAKVILDKQPNARGGLIDLTNTESVIYDPDDSEYQKEQAIKEAELRKKAEKAEKAKSSKAKKDSVKSAESKKTEDKKANKSEASKERTASQADVSKNTGKTQKSQKKKSQ